MDRIDKELQQFLLTAKPGLFEYEADGVLVRCEFTTIDSMACAIQELSVCRDVARTADQLRDTCETLSQQLSYLLEPIQVIECDAELSAVQMRSNPPQEAEQTRRYFELSASANRMTLCRYEKRQGQPRERVECVFTKEVAARLVHDLAAA